MGSSILAQESTPWNEIDNLPRYLTPSELERLHEIGENFESTTMPQPGVRKIAEFERSSGVIIRYPLGIPIPLVRDLSLDTKVYVLVANETRRTQAINEFQSGGVHMAGCEFVLAPTNSMWTRDYGPWFVATADDQIAVMDFIYNRPRASDNNVPNVMAQYLGLARYGLPLVHCGGNFMADGWHTGASTDLVIEENTGGLDRVLEHSFDFLGIEQYIITEDAQGEYIKHIDTWAKFLDVDKILIARVGINHPRYAIYEEIAQYYTHQICAYGYPYKVYRVDTPNGQPYTNSLIVNDKVYVPITGSAWDEPALRAYEEAMPGYDIKGYLGAWISTDALHCRVKEMADPSTVYIRHLPPTESITFRGKLDLEVEIVPYSGSELELDSTMLIFRLDDMRWDTLSLITEDLRHFESSIPLQLGATHLQYYFSSRDMAGNTNHWPLVGKKGPRQVNLQYSQHLKVYPDQIMLTHPTDILDPIQIRIENLGEIVGVVTPLNSSDTSDIWWNWTSSATEPLAVLPQGYQDVYLNIRSDLSMETNVSLTDTLYLRMPHGNIAIPIQLNWSTTSLQDMSTTATPLSIFPNPSFDLIHITHPDIQISEGGRFEVWDVIGNSRFLVQPSEILENASHLSLPVSKLPAGSYFIRYFTNNKVYSGRFIKL